MTSNIEQTLKAALPAIERKWDDEIIPVLQEYIRIPNKSVEFDPNWRANGHVMNAMNLLLNWVKKQKVQGMKVELHEDPNHTPLLTIEVNGQKNDTILLYGHMDKQPEMIGWDKDKGPWTPVLEKDKLYGRGAADDGYALFCALTAIQTLQENNIPHARCFLMIEASEESGSVDLPFYLDKLKDRIGTPDFVITLDSDCSNYEQLWGTTSLRGLIDGVLKIKVLTEGIHSGFGSGTVPSAFCILREILDRIENHKNNAFLLNDFEVDIPAQRIEQARVAAKSIGDAYFKEMPFAGNTQPITTDVAELILNRTWRPALSVTGLEGLPPIEKAGNVTVPEISVKLSMRTPPTLAAENMQPVLKKILESNPPSNAVVEYHPDNAGSGWNSPPLAPWLEAANDFASHLFFNKAPAYLGGGGSIPFMGMLGKKFPKAQFLITGVLGPKSNAHGPNEFLHIPTVKKLTGAVAAVIARHFEKSE